MKPVLNQHKVTLNAEPKFAAQRKVIKKARLLLIFVLALAPAVVAAAQSTDRDHPTPLASDEIKGAGTGKKVEYYYSFRGGPGQVVLTIDLRAKAGATNADVEIFDAGASKIFYVYPNATTQHERVVKQFAVKSRQTLTLRLAFDSSVAGWAVTLGGAVELAPPATSLTTMPASEPGAPDLVIKRITFVPGVPSKIRVLTQNDGAGSSTNCYLALQSLVGDDVQLGTKQRVWSVEIPALHPGKGAWSEIDITPLTNANGPWRAIVDRSNSVKESNENNNTLTYPLPNSTSSPGSVPASYNLPDLLIDHFELTDPQKGEVKIVVVNKGSSGAANAAACTLRLIVWEPGQFEKKEAKTVFVKVPALHTGGKATVIAIAGVPIINTKYSMFVDIGHDVTELNENNNRAEGEAGNYKP
jgi:hypothetical protein